MITARPIHHTSNHDIIKQIQNRSGDLNIILANHPADNLISTDVIEGENYLGATDPVLHSDSKEGSMAGFHTAVRMMLRAISQLLSCFSTKFGKTSPKAIVLLNVLMAGSRKGSSISIRKRILCLTS